MGESNRRARLPIWAMACWFLALAPALRASPLEDPSLSGGAVFTGPSRAHATAIALNPAAMAMMSRGQHVALMGTMRLSQLFVKRDIVRADGTSVVGPEVSSATASPGGLASFDFEIGDRYRIGVSLQTPQAARYPGGEEPFRYHTLGGYSYRFAGTLSASFAAHSRVLFGFGVSLGYTIAEQRFARDTALEAGTAGVESDCDGEPCGIENPLADQRIRVSTRTRDLGDLFAAKNVGVVGGSMVRVTDNWWLAASVILPAGSVTGTLDLDGEVAVTRPPREGGGTLRGDAEIIFDNPITVFFGARGPITEELDLLAHLRYQNTSAHSRDDIRMFGGSLEQGGVPARYPRHRGFADVVQISAGVESPDNRRLRLGGRVNLETGAVGASEITPQQPESLSVGVSLGSQLRVGDHLVLGATYGFNFFPPVNASQSAFNPLDRLACVDQDFDLDACAAARQGRAVPTAAGSYLRLDHTLLLSIRYDTL